MIHIQTYNTSSQVATLVTSGTQSALQDHVHCMQDSEWCWTQYLADLQDIQYEPRRTLRSASLGQLVVP